MKGAMSLRLRLTGIILIPLMTFAIIAGLWQLNNARRTGAEVFDRSLLSAALAVANDVAISEGDALSERTRDILSSTSGGLVFYHVYAPDGVIVAGYATPPVGIPAARAEAAGPTYFEARYLGRAVSGVRLQNRTEIDGFAGIFTTTVWQDSAVRTEFVRDLVRRSFILIFTLILLLALIVWFGVNLGLRPLTDLENAIAQRSSTELSPIRRAVPEEVKGIVDTLNRLFGQMSQAMSAQSEFIANAAHQLRNPIAGVLSLAEAVVAAPNERETKKRANDLLDAARQTADLGQKLLMLERAEALSPQAGFARLDLSDELPEWIVGFAKDLPPSVGIENVVDGKGLPISGDKTMLREAVANLIDNAIRHGGPQLSVIRIRAMRQNSDIVICVEDDGCGIGEDDIPKALERFSQISESQSSGLGLSIVQAIAAGHGGSLELVSQDTGLTARLRLPMAA